MIHYRTREKLKAGPLASVYAYLRRLKRLWRPPQDEPSVFPTADTVVRPDLATLRQATCERPQEPRLLFSLGLEYLEQDDPQQALLVLQQCASLPFEAQERLGLHTARALARLGRGDEAQALIAGLTDRDLTAAEAALCDQVRAAAREDTDHAPR